METMGIVGLMGATKTEEWTHSISTLSPDNTLFWWMGIGGRRSLKCISTTKETKKLSFRDRPSTNFLTLWLKCVLISHRDSEPCGKSIETSAVTVSSTEKTVFWYKTSIMRSVDLSSTIKITNLQENSISCCKNRSIYRNRKMQFRSKLCLIRILRL